MQSAAAKAIRTMQTYDLCYERVWHDGSITEHHFEVEAFKPETAETIFWWRIDRPNELSAQRIVKIESRSKARRK